MIELYLIAIHLAKDKATRRSENIDLVLELLEEEGLGSSVPRPFLVFCVFFHCLDIRLMSDKFLFRKKKIITENKKSFTQKE